MKFRNIILLFSTILFTGCLYFDAFIVELSESNFLSDGSLGIEKRQQPLPGHYLFLYGWLGVLLQCQLYWLANPLLFLSWFTFAKRHFAAALILSVLAMLFGGWFLTVEELAEFGYDMVVPITGLGIGYWLWLASMGLIAIGSGIEFARVEAASETPD